MNAATFIIDPRVSDVSTLVAALPQGSAYFFLDAASDGIDQIAAILAGRDGIDALHIISHGAQGTLLLGSTLLTRDSLGDHAVSLAAIASHLGGDADILLYGCDVASGRAGTEFIASLANITGADVAASNDLTGHGGNWTLEVATGAIDAAALKVAGYAADLAADVATPGDDIFNGTTGAASLDAGDGVDIIDFRTATGPISVDLVNGRAGGIDFNIQLLNFESAYGSEFADTIMLSASDGEAFGGGGDDSLTGAASGHNTLDGGAGNDTLVAMGAVNKMYGGDGNDIIIGGDGRDLLDGGTGDDSLDGGGDVDTIQFTSATGGVAIDMTFGTASGGSGTDTFSNIESVTGSDFDDTITLGKLTTYGDGAGGDDTLIASRFGNQFGGGAGNDTLISGAGIDSMLGGDGIDSVSYRSATAAVVVNLAAGTATGGGGSDYLNEIESAFGSRFGDTITLNGAGGSAFGEGGSDILIAGANDTDLYGGTGNDTLTGGAGSNVLDGGAGQDAMTGGSGDDTYVVDSTLDVVTETADGGDDTVNSAITLTLAANLETLRLRGSEAISGTGNALANTLIGNSAANTLSGLDGDDVLKGGGGSDTMVGGAGDDTYFVDAAGDIVTEALDGGEDSVNSTVSLALAANVENLKLMGSAAINGRGNTLDNALTGNGSANTLTGLGGDDILNGGAGNDTMVGGTGDDTYFVDAAGDVVTEAADGGEDTVRSTVTHVLAVNVENLTLAGAESINGRGNALANTLTGNGAANTITGLGGQDILIGGGGNDILLGGADDDTYYVDGAGDVVTEDAGAGIDTVITAATLTLAANVENLQLVGSLAAKATGNVLANTLSGNGAANTLTGLGGDDILNGGGGSDTMVGGSGNDVYYVDITTDVVTEGVDAGIDTVNSVVTLTLAANVENLNLIGAGAAGGTGNALANILIGNSAANTLSGLGGDDIINGGGGKDTMTGGTGADQFVFANGDFGGATIATADSISDFNAAEGDRIDLRAVDASSVTPIANEAFAFIGTAAFGKVAGQLRTFQSGTSTYIQGDTNGDGTADFLIALDGLRKVDAASFLL